MAEDDGVPVAVLVAVEVRVGVPVGVAVDVAVLAEVTVEVGVRVAVAVVVRLAVRDAVDVIERLDVAVGVGVAVLTTVVPVGVGVRVPVAVDVRVGVPVDVAEAVAVTVRVEVLVGVAVGVAVMLGVNVRVGVGDKVLVALAVAVRVKVGDEVRVALGVAVALGVGVRVGVRVGVLVATPVPAGTLTNTMDALGTVTVKLVPVVMELPVPGMEVTAGFWVPFTLIQRNSWTGVVPPDLVVPAGWRVHKEPAVPAEKPVMDTVTLSSFAKSLLTMKTVRLPEASLEDQQRRLAAFEELDTRFLPKTLERYGKTYQDGRGVSTGVSSVLPEPSRKRP